VWIVPPSLYSKVRVIFAVHPVHSVWGEFVFAITAPYIAYSIKAQC